MSERQSRVTYKVLGMSCVSCAKLVRKSLERNEGVKNVKVNAVTDTFYIDYEPDKISETELDKAITKTGYKAIRLHGLKKDQSRPK